MNGNGYDAATKPSAQFFTKEQRQRLEAVTVTLQLRGKQAPIHEVLRIARYIVDGKD